MLTCARSGMEFHPPCKIEQMHATVLIKANDNNASWNVPYGKGVLTPHFGTCVVNYDVAVKWAFIFQNSAK